MKSLKFLAILSLAVLSTPNAAIAGDRPFTFERMYLRQRIDGQVPVVTGYESLAYWCRNGSSTVSILGSYDVAKFIGAQASGFYDCTGQFGRELDSTNYVIYKIISCTPVNPDELRKTCPA